MDFLTLANLFEQLEKTSSGNTMREILAEYLQKVSPEHIGVIWYLTLGKIASDYEDVDMGMADKSVLKSIAMAGGADGEKVKKIFQEVGDAGLTAEKVLQKKPRTLVPLGTLTVHEEGSGVAEESLPAEHAQRYW